MYTHFREAYLCLAKPSSYTRLKSHAVVLSYTSLYPSARLGTSALGGSGCHDPGPGSSFCRLGTTYDRRSSVPRRPTWGPSHNRVLLRSLQARWQRSSCRSYRGGLRRIRHGVQISLGTGSTLYVTNYPPQYGCSYQKSRPPVAAKFCARAEEAFNTNVRKLRTVISDPVYKFAKKLYIRAGKSSSKTSSTA